MAVLVIDVLEVIQIDKDQGAVAEPLTQNPALASMVIIPIEPMIGQALLCGT